VGKSSGAGSGAAFVSGPEPVTVFVHICQNSPIARHADLLKGEGRRVECTDCLDECTVCERVPFAFVQGELVRAPSCEALATLVATRVGHLRRRRAR